MTAAYPGAIAALTRPVHDDPGNDDSATDATVVVGAQADEIEAIQNTLGTNPQGPSATVKARIAAIEANYATSAAVSAAVSAGINGLINGAPGALDTLLELATAMGNDPAFATTVVNALAGKQPLDSDLTAIAALSTTPYGRAVLELANQAALVALLPTVAQGQAGLAPAIASTPSSTRVLSETGWKAEASGGGGYATVQDEGSGLTARTTLDVVGPGATASDTGSKTQLLIPGFWERPTSANGVVFPPHLYSATGYNTQSEMLACRVYLTAGEVFKGISSRVSVVGSGCTFRAGVYAESGSIPNTLVSGTEVSHSISGTGATTDLFGSTWTVPTSGFYWIATSLDGSGSAPTAFSWLLQAPIGTATASVFPARNGVAYKDLSYSGGALSSTFSGAAQSTNPNLMPIVYLVRN